MLKLLQLLFVGHAHKWKILEIKEYKWSNDFGEYGTGRNYYLQCEICGVVHRKRFK